MITDGQFHLQDTSSNGAGSVEVILHPQMFSLTQGDQIVNLTWGQMRSLYLLIESLLRDAGITK